MLFLFLSFCSDLVFQNYELKMNRSNFYAFTRTLPYCFNPDIIDVWSRVLNFGEVDRSNFTIFRFFASTSCCVSCFIFILHIFFFINLFLFVVLIVYVFVFLFQLQTIQNPVNSSEVMTNLFSKYMDQQFYSMNLGWKYADVDMVNILFLFILFHLLFLFLIFYVL